MDLLPFTLSFLDFWLVGVDFLGVGWGVVAHDQRWQPSFWRSVCFPVQQCFSKFNMPVYHLGSSWNGDSDSGSLGGAWNSACLTGSWMIPNSKARFSPRRPTGCGFLHHPAYPSWCRNLSTGATARWALGLCPGAISAEDSLSQRGGQAWMVFTLDQDFSPIKPLIIRLVCRIEQS